MSQEIQTIKIGDLHLWTENPRDPIDPDANNEDIILRAIASEDTKWNLDKLIVEMGEFYDFSELPTVVVLDGKNVVFDGNRRIAAIMCLQNTELYSNTNGKIFTLPIPSQIQELSAIPCNVCDRETALDSIQRKHYNHGTWKPLARDYFMHIHRNKPKSDFIKFEEATGLVTAHEKELNTVYARDELIIESELSKIGFRIQDDAVLSNYRPEDSNEILDTVVKAIQNDKTTTRHNRGDLVAGVIEQNPELANKIHDFSDTAPTSTVSRVVEVKKVLLPRRTQATTMGGELFGGKLILQSGAVNDLYRGITNVYESQRKDTDKLRLVFPILCFSFRLILEVAAKEHYGATESKPFSALINQAKKDFRQNGQNTELSDLSVNTPWFDGSTNLEAVLHNYAHNNLTVGIGDVLKYSNIVGQILTRYFGRKPA